VTQKRPNNPCSDEYEHPARGKLKRNHNSCRDFNTQNQQEQPDDEQDDGVSSSPSNRRPDGFAQARCVAQKRGHRYDVVGVKAVCHPKRESRCNNDYGGCVNHVLVNARMIQ
jgi:hypothetical protein